MLRTKLTAAEFLALPESNQHRELIDGEVVTNPPKAIHQRIVGYLFLYLQNLIPSGEVLLAPVGLYLNDTNLLEPDLMWIGKGSACTEGADGYFYGAPDLIVEVLSPSTARIDKVQKFQLYEQSSVREYWIVDPHAESVEVWFSVNQTLAYHGNFPRDTHYVSPILGANIEVARFFRPISERIVL
jgi:Uma2 family endonuclease